MNKSPYYTTFPTIERKSYKLEHYSPTYLVKLAFLIENGVDFQSLMTMSMADTEMLYRAFQVRHGTSIEEAFGEVAQ